MKIQFYKRSENQLLGSQSKLFSIYLLVKGKYISKLDTIVGMEGILGMYKVQAERGVL